MDKKILIIGFGSIGKRHLRNILSLGYRDVSIISRLKKTDDEFPSVKFYQSIETAFQTIFFNTVFICTPTSLHISNLLELLKYKVKNIYIEKPISHSYEKIDEVLQLASSYKNNIVVGYDLHFDSGLQKVKELFSQNIIGKIVSANAFVGQHLSQWRPHEDHRKGMSAKHETGGGVLLDLIHEFNYLHWLAGDIDYVMCDHINTNELQIETEESANILLKFVNGTSATIHLDYLQKKIIRNCIFTGTKGTIILDLAKRKVNWIDENETENEFDYSRTERNDRFISIARSFLENEKDEKLTSIDNGLKSLQIVLAAKRSFEEKRLVKISEIF
jgi:predicted dehydrogenase